MKWICLDQTGEIINLEYVIDIYADDCNIVISSFTDKSKKCIATVVDSQAAIDFMMILADYLNDCDVLRINNPDKDTIILAPSQDA